MARDSGDVNTATCLLFASVLLAPAACSRTTESPPIPNESLPAADPAVAAAPSGSGTSGWYRPVPVEARVFPVLRPARMSWLQWRDDFGLPVMRKNPDGTFEQIGRHEGVDVYADVGTPVVSVTDGVLQKMGWTQFSGNRAFIQAPDGRFFFYAHLASYQPGMAEGRRVAAGEIIGRVGSSGYGPEGTSEKFPAHLHFGIQVNEQWENPANLLRVLYEASVTRTREGEARLRTLEARLERLRTGGSPEGNHPEVAAIQAEIDALRASFYLDVPAA